MVLLWRTQVAVSVTIIIPREVTTVAKDGCQKFQKYYNQGGL